MNNALLVGNQMNNNLPGGEDCGCDGGSSNVDMMSRNLGMPAQQAIHNNMNANTNSKPYEYFSRRINYILENPKLIHRRKRGRTTDNLRNRIRSKIREINLRKCGYYSKSFSTLISRL